MSTQAGVRVAIITGASSGIGQTAANDHTVTLPSPIAVSLRVPNVRQAAPVYQQIGFTFVMAVPDEHDDWILCLLRYGSGVPRTCAGRPRTRSLPRQEMTGGTGTVQNDDAGPSGS